MAYPLIELVDLQEWRQEVFLEAQQPQVLRLIRFASAVVRDEVPTLDTDVQNAVLDRDLVEGIMCVVVSRALDSMRVGTNIKSEQFPEITTEYNFQSVDMEEVVYLSAGQKERLSPKTEQGSSFSIAPG
ncbi:hypothetical protein CH305_18465 [Rhodococcus sp. 15-649-2-2]|uniref:hypothetical protein n=1 Tax=Rhodococcus sp. 15-649-2-2 TaxID=2023140 RepID=UPI000B9A25B8|nr:hypothetical protein [Rhodococcus sp. 15-649-2-2]OZE77221.1 hypothetical protein CH305_18465 [Rhodococcus sp. 15-649-2-2]